jgi:hypothetical protein
MQPTGLHFRQPVAGSGGNPGPSPTWGEEANPRWREAFTHALPVWLVVALCSFTVIALAGLVAAVAHGAWREIIWIITATIWCGLFVQQWRRV